MQTRPQLRIGQAAALLTGALLALPAAAQEPSGIAAESYARALQRAKTVQSPGDVDAAVRALAALLPSYLQDVELPLALGELTFRSGRLQDALYSYQLALNNSAPGGEAELGLAWTLVKLGRCLEARVHFQTVLTTTPTASTAAEGLRQCSAPAPTPSPTRLEPAPRLWLQPLVAQSFYFYQNHPTVSYVLAPTVRLEALLRGHYYGAATYRYSYFATRQTAAWSQHDLYLDAGYSARAAGFTLHYALLADGSGYSGTTHHVGLTGRYSRGFDALLNLSASFFADTPVLRGELAWVLPIAGGFSARPAAAVQWNRTETFKTLALTLAYSHRSFSLWLGGKYGDEQRAAYLNVGYVYNSPARIPYGAWAGAALRPGRKFTLTLNYSYDRLLRRDTSPPQDSPVHALTLGLAREF